MTIPVDSFILETVWPVLGFRNTIPFTVAVPTARRLPLAVKSKEVMELVKLLTNFLRSEVQFQTDTRCMEKPSVSYTAMSLPLGCTAIMGMSSSVI